MKNFLKDKLPPRVFYYLKRKIKRNFDERYLIYDFLDYKQGIMFDVGVMDGSSFMPFLLKGWDIYAFEPDNQNYKVVSDYLAKWNLKIDLSKNAISDVKETKMFFTSTSSKGIPSLLKFNENQVASHKVNTITLKDFVKSNEIEKIDFLKIDIEGYDLMALKGFDFSSFRPKVIMCEFEDLKTNMLGYSTNDIAQFLIDKSYYLIYSIWHPIKEYGKQHDWIKMTENIEELEADNWGNIIAFSNELDYNEFRKKHKI